MLFETLIISIIIVLIILIIVLLLHMISQQKKEEMRDKTGELIGAMIRMGIEHAIEGYEGGYIIEDDIQPQSPRNRLEAIDRVLNQEYTSDPQNVHDSKVNNDIREIIRILRESSPNPNSLKAIQEAQKWIRERYMSDKLTSIDKVSAAEAVLKIISNGRYISTYSYREDIIFALVWERSSHPNNAENADSMKTAVIEALADCIENNEAVCINGRVGRIIGSLATLDFNAATSQVHSSDMYKNEIFNRVKIILEDAIIDAARSNDPDLQDIAKSFVNPDICTVAEKEEIFRNCIIDKITVVVGEYSGAFTPAELNKIIEDCSSAI